MGKNNKNKTIVLQGNWSEYSFKPLLSSSRLRKISKFSRVYKGFSTDGKPVVVKVLPDDIAKDAYSLECFKKEINWFGAHPNLLAPFEYIFQENRHFLISEMVQAIDISYYRRHKRFFKRKRIKLAIDCGLQLLDAVEHLHNKGVIHADIKPANVMLMTNRRKRIDLSNPVFQLIDFGMVRKIGEIPQSSKKTQRPFVLVYSPPEQVLGFHELVGIHSDLYNIALLMYEMITTKPAYESNLSVKLMNLQTSFPLPNNKTIPSELMCILHKAASKYHFKKPPNHYKRDAIYHRLQIGIENRYHSASEFRQALKEFQRSYYRE